MLTRNLAAWFLILAVALIASPYSHAIPAFSRQYGTSCTTCHTDFPKLNDFGKAFKDAGFKFPKNDEDFIKIPPVMLGAPAQKEMFPKVVWPGTIPGIPQVGLRFNQFFQYTGRSANNYYNNNNLAGSTPGSLLPPGVPRTDFEPGFFSIFMAGNFGSLRLRVPGKLVPERATDFRRLAGACLRLDLAGDGPPGAIQPGQILAGPVVRRPGLRHPGARRLSGSRRLEGRAVLACRHVPAADAGRVVPEPGRVERHDQACARARRRIHHGDLVPLHQHRQLAGRKGGIDV